MNTILLNSLYRVFPDDCPTQAMKELSGFGNEPLSFQLAYRLKTENVSIPIYIRVESELPVFIYGVDYVPVRHTSAEGLDHPPKPGLFPDILLPKSTNPNLKYLKVPGSSSRYTEENEIHLLNASSDSWQSVWFTVNKQKIALKAGEYTIKIKVFHSVDRSLLAEEKLTIRIIDALLPKQRLIYTNWLHCDCICDLHHVTLFSEEFWNILESYLTVAAERGMNMVLMPAFTPPLDIPIGTERMTVQLVEVEKNRDGYSFDFSKMERFTNLCKKVGIEYLEHSHLFSQWGAKSAPKIIDKNGAPLFGWETDAASKEYGDFLKQYLTALIRFLKDKDLESKIFFHISDEPKDTMMEDYKKATAQVREILKPYNSGDALSHYCFYEDGTVKTPIVRTKEADDFVGRCDNMWGYYTGKEVHDGLSNRVLTLPPERNRMMGIHLYQYKMKGFLHWGLNYYYDVLSHGIFDPRYNPCGYRNHAGTSFFVYPAFNGTALPSMRQTVFAEGIYDYEALLQLEKKYDRNFCEELLKKHFGKITMNTAPSDPEQIIHFRKELNEWIVK